MLLHRNPHQVGVHLRRQKAIRVHHLSVRILHAQIWLHLHELVVVELAVDEGLGRLVMRYRGLYIMSIGQHSIDDWIVCRQHVLVSIDWNLIVEQGCHLVGT